MQTPKVNPLVRLLPSLTDLAFMMPIAMLFLVLNGTKTMLGDGDTGWHIRTGEWILSHGQVPTVDMFSYTKAGEPWYAWEWLWDVIFGWMHMQWGMASVVLVSILILCLTSALLFRLAVHQSGNVLISIAVTFVAMVASSIHWLARPHLFTMLFVVVFLSILERVRKGRMRLLFSLPAITLLWTNLHGGFFVGIVLIGTYAAGEWVAAVLASNTAERRAAVSRSIPYVIAAVACLAVSFVNPYGYKLHVHMVEYLSDPYHRQNISEFQSASFQPASARFFEVLLALGLLAAYSCVRRRRYANALVIVSWGHLALIAARNIPLFGLAAAGLIAEYLSTPVSVQPAFGVPRWLCSALEQLAELAVNIGLIERTGRIHLASMLPTAALTAILFAPGVQGKWQSEYDPKVYPDAALRSLTHGELSAGVFTDDEWGAI